VERSGEKNSKRSEGEGLRLRFRLRFRFGSCESINESRKKRKGKEGRKKKERMEEGTAEMLRIRRKRRIENSNSIITEKIKTVTNIEEPESTVGLNNINSPWCCSYVSGSNMPTIGKTAKEEILGSGDIFEHRFNVREVRVKVNAVIITKIS